MADLQGSFEVRGSNQGLAVLQTIFCVALDNIVLVITTIVDRRVRDLLTGIVQSEQAGLSTQRLQICSHEANTPFR